MDSELGNQLPTVRAGFNQGQGRTIGAILVDSGKLTPEDAEEIVELQRREGLRFGEAALMLGKLSEADLQFALAQQYDYSYLQPGKSEVSSEVIAAYHPFSKEVESLRALRRQIMVRWLNPETGGRAVSVVSTDRGEGRSFLSANLAVVFSQLGSKLGDQLGRGYKTLLIDGDLRNPRQHQLFGISNRSGLSAVLSGRGELDSIQQVPLLPNLFIMPAGPLPPNPQELLERPLLPRLLDELGKEYDVIIVDSPAGSSFADAQALSSCAGAALMVVRTNGTRIKAANAFVAELAACGVNVIGTVINKYGMDSTPMPAGGNAVVPVGTARAS